MEIDELRKKIDAYDAQIIELLNARTHVVLDIGKYKNERGEEIFSAARESAVYEKIEQINKGPLPNDSLKSIYREIMSASLALEKNIQIAYLGPSASFTNLAALSKFGNSVDYVPCESIGDVFLEVDRGNADYGVIPIENSTEGAVRHSLDMFIDSDLKICNEISLEIKLFVLSNSKIGDIKKIYSKAEALAQCRVWLKHHLPKVELIETGSTTIAARKAANEQGSAAIASELAAVLYNLNVIGESVEDSPHNVTRFLVIGRTIPDATGKDKTSFVCSIKDKVGALHDILNPIFTRGINMTKIESRPSKKKAWDYFFFIDIEGHCEDENVKAALAEIEDRVRFLKVLGSYPNLS